MFLFVLLKVLLLSLGKVPDDHVLRSDEKCSVCGIRGSSESLAFQSDIVLLARLTKLDDTAIFDIEDASLSRETSVSGKKPVCISEKAALHELVDAIHVLERERNRGNADPALWLLLGHDGKSVTWHRPLPITAADFRHIVSAKTFFAMRDCDETVCAGLVKALLDRESRLNLVICGFLRDLCIDSPDQILLRARSMPHELLHHHVFRHQSDGPLDGARGITSGVSEYLLCALLAACGNTDDDVLILNRLFDERRVDSSVDPTAAVAVFLESRGARGMDLLESRLITYALSPTLTTLQANSRRGWVDAVMSGILSVKKSGKISNERLQRCIQKVLTRKEYLPRAIQMTVVLEDWSQGDVMADHFTSGVKDEVGVRLVNYLHTVSEKGSESQVRNAKESLDVIRKTHPHILEAARQRFGWQD